MKITFTILTLFTSLSAMADCPDLQGTYQCQDGEAKYEIEMNQKTSNGVTTYTSKKSFDEKTDTMVTDGNERPEVLDGIVAVNTGYFCSGNELKGVFQSTQDEPFKITGEVVYKKTHAGLKTSMSFSVNGAPAGGEELHCNKK